MLRQSSHLHISQFMNHGGMINLPTVAPSALPFTSEEYARRLHRVRRALDTAGVDVAVLTAPDTIAWLTGYRTRWYRQHTSTAFPPTLALIVDRIGELFALLEVDYHRELAIEHSIISDFRAIPTKQPDGEPLLGEIAAFIRQTVSECGKVVGMERWSCVPSPAVSAVIENELTSACHEITDVSLPMRAVRRFKSPEEITMVRRAQYACDAGIRDLVNVLHPEMSGLEAWAHYSLGMVRAGGEPAALHETVAGGASVSAIHALSSQAPLGSGSVVYPDMAAAVHGYHARATRPVTIGKAPHELSELIDHAFGLRELISEFAKPGVEWADLASLVKEYSAGTGREIEAAAYELGLSVPPTDWVGECSWSSVNPPAGQIEASLVTNIELSNGVNIVDTLVFGANGAEWLSSLPFAVLETSGA